MKYNELVKRFTRFVYESFQYEIEEEEIKLTFHYFLESDDEKIPFVHRVSYHVKGSNDINVRPEMLKARENYIFHIGLVETINYWKLACPKQIHIRCGKLTEEQENWWKKLFFNGLGEFIYLNGIAEEVTEETFVSFYSTAVPVKNNYAHIKSETLGSLIPVGGGKDSVVTLEILKEYKEDNLPFVMSAPVAAYDCIEVAGYTSYLEAKRIFDKRMMEMNKEGYLNGHVPFSAILAFIALFGASITKKEFIPLSNEKSANEPSVIGTTFNHQYSKSYEFEKDFNEYNEKFLQSNITYFSLLRTLYETEIGKMFANYTNYHKVFRSCNRGKKENAWCLDCPKCLFVYIILRKYMHGQEVDAMFGEDLLEKESLQEDFLELVGAKDTKPFECVGTVWEVKDACDAIIMEYEIIDEELPYLLKLYKELEIFKQENPKESYETGHEIPEEFLVLLQKERARLELF